MTTHHIIPKREHGEDKYRLPDGSIDPALLVELCRTCHDVTEMLINRQIYPGESAEEVIRLLQERGYL